MPARWASFKGVAQSSDDFVESMYLPVCHVEDFSRASSLCSQHGRPGHILDMDDCAPVPAVADRYEQTPAERFHQLPVVTFHFWPVDCSKAQYDGQGFAIGPACCQSYFLCGDLGMSIQGPRRRGRLLVVDGATICRTVDRDGTEEDHAAGVVLHGGIDDMTRAEDVDCLILIAQRR